MMLAKSTSVVFESGKTQHRLTGRSRAGDATCFAIPDLRWLFDCGALLEGWKPKVLFLTHTHSDHAHYLTHVNSEQNPPIVYLPVEAAPFVKAHIHSFKEMTDCMTEIQSQNGGKYTEEYVFRPSVPGEEISFRQGGTTFVVRTLKMDHRVPCLGYSIFKMQEKLKKEYEGVPGKEIGRLRKSGVVVTESHEEPFICFLGDTTSKVFRFHPEILHQQSVIVVECSFIDSDSVERARITTHMHWDDLRPYVEANPRVLFLLTHFSLKYSALELREFFCKQQEQYDNIHPMLVEEEIEDIWKRRKTRSSDANVLLPKCSCRVCK